MRAATESILTLADLTAWSFPGVALAVIGRPVAHSLSPVIQNAALAELAKTQPRFADWRYFKFDIAPAGLPGALALFHEKKFPRPNLPVPHKPLAADHLAPTAPFPAAAPRAGPACRCAEPPPRVAPPHSPPRPSWPARPIAASATSLDLAPGPPPPSTVRKIPPPARFQDMIPRPPQTALLRQAPEL